MGRSGVLQEVRVMRFEDLLGRYSAGRLSCEEAADVLGMSVSSFYPNSGGCRRFAGAGVGAFQPVGVGAGALSQGGERSWRPCRTFRKA
jgi:hypothetical protein